MLGLLLVACELVIQTGAQYRGPPPPPPPNHHGYDKSECALLIPGLAAINDPKYNHNNN